MKTMYLACLSPLRTLMNYLIFSLRHSGPSLTLHFSVIFMNSVKLPRSVCCLREEVCTIKYSGVQFVLFWKLCSISWTPTFNLSGQSGRLSCWRALMWFTGTSWMWSVLARISRVSGRQSVRGSSSMRGERTRKKAIERWWKTNPYTSIPAVLSSKDSLIGSSITSWSWRRRSTCGRWRLSTPSG